MTIKKNLECPHCGERVFLHLRETTSALSQRSRIDVQWSLWWHPSGCGSFETFVCKGCGYTEWYAHGLTSLRPDPERGIDLIDARLPPSGRPFR